MKSLILAASLLFVGYSSLKAQEPLAVGTIVPERITFSIGDASTNGSSLENLRLGNFRQFDDQVIILMYHASW